MLTLSFSQAAVNFTSVEFDDSQQIAVLGTDKANILFFDMSGPKPLLLQSLHVADGKEKGKGVKVRSLTLDPTSRRLYLTIGAALYVMPMPEKSHLTNKYVTGQLDPHKNGVTCLIAPKQSTLSAMTETLKIKAMMVVNQDVKWKQTNNNNNNTATAASSSSSTSSSFTSSPSTSSPSSSTCDYVCFVLFVMASFICTALIISLRIILQQLVLHLLLLK
jgi:hypothetical protein